MAGGIGSRFWPISRMKFPKQFHDVLGTGKTLLQQTISRFENIVPKENILIVTNKVYADLVKSQAPFLSDDQILGEPVGRNTAPCIAYGCYKIRERNPNANIIVAPSDHVILKEKDFEDRVTEALKETSEKEVLVTFGIKPSRPDTGYGYIQYIESNDSIFKKVKTFTEKPALELAQKFIESGDFLWNAGIFIWNVKTIIHSIEQFMPEMAETFEEGKVNFWKTEEEQFIQKAYSQCKNISIDYGIMEKADNVYVLLSDFGWSDLGTWKSLYDLSEKNEDGNVVQGNVLVYHTNNCIIKTPADKLVVIHGLNDFIVAEYEDVLMICKKEDEQKVKDFVADVKSKKGEKFT
jgi:mannose-1-phosphate guanylyltransferase